MKNKVWAVLCADLHLRQTPPVARIDDYWEAQAHKIQALREFQRAHACPVCCAGDVFDSVRCGHGLVSWAMQNLPDKMVAIPGQHDLPGHSHDMLMRSPLGVLIQAQKVALPVPPLPVHRIGIAGVPWGTALDGFKPYLGPAYLGRAIELKIVMIHALVVETREEAQLMGGVWYEDILNHPDIADDDSGYTILLCGDNHVPFRARSRDGRCELVVPGSMMRMTTRQIDYHPHFYSVEEDGDGCFEVVAHPYPVSADPCFDSQGLEGERVRAQRLDAFIEHLRTDYEAGTSFPENLRRFLHQNPVEPRVQDLLWQALDEVEARTKSEGVRT